MSTESSYLSRIEYMVHSTAMSAFNKIKHIYDECSRHRFKKTETKEKIFDGPICINARYHGPYNSLVSFVFNDKQTDMHNCSSFIITIFVCWFVDAKMAKFVDDGSSSVQAEKIKCIHRLQLVSFSEANDAHRNKSLSIMLNRRNSKYVRYECAFYPPPTSHWNALNKIARGNFSPFFHLSLSLYPSFHIMNSSLHILEPLLHFMRFIEVCRHWNMINIITKLFWSFWKLSALETQK